MPTCKAHIKRVYKTRKAASIWPKYQNCDHNPLCESLPVCGGTVTASMRLTEEPNWGGSTWSVEMRLVCSKCEHPYIDGVLDMPYSIDDELLSKMATVYLDSINANH
jgi:hypothetical protein